MYRPAIPTVGVSAALAATGLNSEWLGWSLAIGGTVLVIGIVLLIIRRVVTQKVAKPERAR